MSDIDVTRRNKRPRQLTDAEKEKLEEYTEQIHYSARLVVFLGFVCPRVSFCCGHFHYITSPFTRDGRREVRQSCFLRLFLLLLLLLLHQTLVHGPAHRLSQPQNTIISSKAPCVKKEAEGRKKKKKR